ncbi:MAG: FUSC family protein [Mycobacterium sp.]
MNPRWPIALRAAISTAIPIVVGSATGNVGAGLIATLGAFTARFGGDRPYLNRGAQLGVVAVALAAAVSVGSWAAPVPWVGVIVVSAVAVAAVWLCHALAVGPPGAYVFALACAAGVGVSASRLAPWQIGALVLAGGAVAWLVQMAGALRDLRRPERAAVAAAGAAVADYLDAVGSPEESAARHRAATALHRAWNVLIAFQPVDRLGDDTLQRLRATTHALHVLFADSLAAAPDSPSTAPHHGPSADAAAMARLLGTLKQPPEAVPPRDPDRTPLGRPRSSALLLHALRPGSHIRHVMVRVAIAAPVAGAAATLLGIGHAYWAIAAAVLVLHQGSDRSGTLRRGADRLSGTWVGLILAGGVLLLHPQGWWLAIVVAGFQFVIEMLVTRNYRLASVFITAAALTISTGTHRVDIGDLLLARGSDTLVGCAVGIAVFLVAIRFQEATRLSDSVADTVAAAAAVSPHFAGDTGTLAARTARRDLQVAAIDLRDAADAAAAGSAPLREIARRLEPVVLAAERLAYATIAVCWAMDGRGCDPLLTADAATGYGDQLRGLAQAVRAGAAPPEVPDAPAGLTADVAVLRAALQQNVR